MSVDKKAAAADKVMKLDLLKVNRHSPDEEQPSLQPSVSRTLSSREGQPATMREKSGTIGNLSSYGDTGPQRRNQRARTETAMPSNRGGMKEQPSRLDKKWGLVGDMPFQDLLWICEQSFRKEAATLSKEILTIARNEFSNVTDALLNDIRQPVETLADDIIPKIDKTLQEVEAPAKVIWEPMNEGFRNQGERLDSLQRQLLEELALLRGEVQELQQQQKDGAKGICEQVEQVKGEVLSLNDEMAKRADRQVTQVLNVQQSLTAECLLVSNGVKELHEEMRATHDQLFPRMDETLKKFVQDEPVNVNFGPINACLNDKTKAILNNQSDIVGALNAIKVELQMEVHAKMEEHKQNMNVRLEEVTRVTEHTSNAMLRDSWVQTEPPSVSERSAQTDGKVLFPKRIGSDTVEKAAAEVEQEAELQKKKEKDKIKVFADGEAMRRRARQALMRPQYDVANYYKSAGWAQAVAKHWAFEYFTYIIIFANAIWIAVDIDNNEANLLIHAEPQFMVVENVFCFYFTCELLVRFLAFKNKRNCIRDMWFVFDFFLVSAMIVETWLVTMVFWAAGIGNSPNINQLSGLRMFRMVKMVRLSRMAKLLRAIPELLVLIKAIGAALRSMAIFFLLWLVVIYVFAVMFRQFTEGGALEQTLFPSVPDAMNTLLVQGILPDNKSILTSVTEDQWWYFPLMMAFILLTSITLMYMLIGVLTEVIHLVANTEKEGMLVSMVATRLRQAITSMGRSTEDPLSKLDFQELMVQPEVASLCQDVGVNVVVLVDMSDVIFESIDKDGSGMNFESLVEVVLNMRGTNPATVKDVKEQLRVIKGLVNDSTSGVLHKLTRGFEKLSKEIKAIRICVEGVESDS